MSEELGPEVEVETHIEPLQPHDQPGRDAAAGAHRGGARRTDRDRGRIDLVGEVHDVRVRETPDGEIVNFHCCVDPALKVQARTRRSTTSSARCAPASRRSKG